MTHASPAASSEPPARGARRWRLVTLAAALLLGATSPGAGGERWDALREVRAVAVHVEVAEVPRWLTAEALTGRVQGMLKQRQPGPWPRPDAPDRLRLSVAVRRHGASELRGFWLPFSSTYGVGVVRLTLERPVSLSGLAAPLLAVVWEAERPVAGSWAQAEPKVIEALEGLMVAFLADYRQANP
jgi:hypothetical protein